MMDSSPMSPPELDLDPSDPLNLLLRNSSNNSEQNMLSDWTSLWPSDSANGFSISGLNMEPTMEFSSDSMVIDPSALHFDAQKLNYPYTDEGSAHYSLNDVLSGTQHFPFTFQNDNLNLEYPSQRRLSVTSSSESSSGASLSPIIEHKPALGDPAAELAQRVRKSAGVTLAVPMQHQQHVSQLSPIASTPPQSVLSFSSASSAASTPPPSTPPPTFAEHPVIAQPQNGGMSMLPRPKTSHTTIERRYRTNLNARIQSLRMAVPALRVLENQSDLGPSSVGGTRKVKVKVPIGKVFRVKREGDTTGDDQEFDVVDERGYVDGVKVARKCSKANVLGKAVEYIRVLKKRENRLKREQQGLKSLISGLVGGAALLNAWEKEWKEKFGGPEKDEITDEDLVEAGGGDGADSDEDDEDDGDDDDGERRRKKTKVAPGTKKEPKDRKAPQPLPSVIAGDGSPPEKRKRGRPRKTPLVTPASSAQSIPAQFASQEQVVQPQPAQGPTQYLLATFALFSFFNSPLTSTSYSSYTPSTHTGTVLSNTSRDMVTSVPVSWGWRELIQAFHLLVSLCVFVSIVLPWLPSKISMSFSSKSPKKNDTKQETTSSSLIAALEPQRRGTADEARILKETLGVTSIFSQVFRLVLLLCRSPTALEGKAWVRLAELLILSGETTSWMRIITSLHLNAYILRQDKSPENAEYLATLALLLQPLGTLAQVKTQSSWDEARCLASASHEKLVMESLDVDRAVKCLSTCSREETTPVNILAAHLIREGVRVSLQQLFTQTVFPQEAEDCSAEGKQERERKKMINAAKSLNGRTGRLGNILEGMWRSPATPTSSSAFIDDASSSEEEQQQEVEDQDEIKALVTSISLFRDLFSASSALLSPPPSPSSTPRMGSNTRGRQSRSKYLLRRALGSSVFENGGDDGGRLEDARDKVVDLLGAWDRRERRR